MTRRAVFHLPRPFSLNNKDANLPSGGRVKTAAYRAWIAEAQAMIMAAGPRPRFDRPVMIHLDVGFDGVSPLFDLDNAIKPALDVLVGMRIIPDDRRKFVQRVSAQWCADEGCRATVEECR